MMKRVAVLGMLLAAGALSAVISAQQGQSRPPLPDAQKVKDNLWVITSSTPGPEFTGGNTGIFVTDTGVVVVDTKLSGYGPTILEKIKKITDKPVTTIINTHTHGDHTGSNEAFPATVDFVAHENTKANMAKMSAFAGDKAQFLPKRTYKDKMTVGSGKNEIDLYYFGPGHTNGDSWVVYKSLRVLQTGDMFAWRDAPTIDRNNGGSGIEYPKTLAKAIAGIKDVDTVIPGHSPVTTPKDLQQYQKFMAQWIAAVEAANKAGKSAKDAAASIDLTSKYPGYKKERYETAITAVYDELKK
ncbi:MAG TPA: MBL fold metallo-hydrolase [Vicinamibacterales bacterium]|nr:MBL fold metallo-hydrolase [Vicinamibacterales bacterium]